MEQQQQQQQITALREIVDVKLGPGRVTDDELAELVAEGFVDEEALTYVNESSLVRMKNLREATRAMLLRWFAGGLGLGPGSQAGAARLSEEQQNLARTRARTAAKYRGYMLDGNGKPQAVTIFDPSHAVTFAHGRDKWEEGCQVDVFVNDPGSDRPTKRRVTVFKKHPKMDVAVLSFNAGGPMEAPVLDADIHPGEQYILLGYSSSPASGASPEQYASVSHGSVSTSELDKHAHIRGDTPSSPGDSGGGVFSIETGKLIGINVGREKIAGSDGTLKDGYKSVLVPIAGVAALIA